jgi:hypothetical protein
MARGSASQRTASEHIAELSVNIALKIIDEVAKHPG